eukprot:scaffold181067_cov42-Prasinocladus_malaysianus.AAC.1
MARGRGGRANVRGKDRGNSQSRASPTSSASAAAASKAPTRQHPTSPRALRRISRAAEQRKKGSAKGGGGSKHGVKGRSRGSKPGPRGAEAVGRRVQIYWPTRSKWRAGDIVQYDEQRDLHL